MEDYAKPVTHAAIQTAIHQKTPVLAVKVAILTIANCNNTPPVSCGDFAKHDSFVADDEPMNRRDLVNAVAAIPGPHRLVMAGSSKCPGSAPTGLNHQA